MPGPELTTTRLVLRPMDARSRELLHRHWNEPAVGRYLWDGGAVSMDTVDEVIAASDEHFAATGLGLWVLSLPDDGPFAGFCGFRPAGEHMELLYSLEPHLWGRGLATEAAERTIRYAFDDVGLTTLLADTDAPNEASVRVLTKLGMTEQRRFHREGLKYEQVRFLLPSTA